MFESADSVFANATTPAEVENRISGLVEDRDGAQNAIVQADAALDAALDAAKQAHAEAVRGHKAQIQHLDALIAEGQDILMRKKAAQEKASKVIAASLSRERIEAMLRASIAAECPDLDQATMDSMVAQALDAQMPAPPKPAALPAPKEAAPSAQAAPAAPTPKAVATKPMVLSTAVLSGAPQANPIPPTPNATITDVGPTRIVTLPETPEMAADRKDKGGWASNPFKR